jgi:hypothetical protein
MIAFRRLPLLPLRCLRQCPYLRAEWWMAAVGEEERWQRLAGVVGKLLALDDSRGRAWQVRQRVGKG